MSSENTITDPNLVAHQGAPSNELMLQAQRKLNIVINYLRHPGDQLRYIQTINALLWLEKFLKID